MYRPNLIYLECYFSDIEELSKLNLEAAKHIFILSWVVENTDDLDSGILPLVKRIDENFRKCNITVELSDFNNMRYVCNNTKFRNKNPYEKLPLRFWPRYAKSNTFFSSSLDGLLVFAYCNEGELEILLKLLEIKTEDQKMDFSENSSISTITYKGAKIDYMSIFSYLINLDESIIPLGLYRQKNQEDLENEGPYVITNPKKITNVYPTDQIICLGKCSKIKIDNDDLVIPNKTIKTNTSFCQSSDMDLSSDSNSFNIDKSFTNEELDNMNIDFLKEIFENELKKYIEIVGEIPKSVKKAFKSSNVIDMKPVNFMHSNILGRKFNFKRRSSSNIHRKFIHKQIYNL